MFSNSKVHSSDKINITKYYMLHLSISHFTLDSKQVFFLTSENPQSLYSALPTGLRH